MFHQRDTRELVEALNNFQIPMFAVDLEESGLSRAAGHNDAFGRLSGFGYDAIGKDMYRLLKPEDAEFACAMHHRCGRSGKRLDVSGILDYPSGQVMHSTTLIPVCSEDGEVRRVVGNILAMDPATKEGADPSMLREITELASDIEITLGRALMLIENRSSAPGEMPPDEIRFLRTFRDLCLSALSASARLRTVADEGERDSDAMDTMMKNSVLAHKVRELALHHGR